MASKRLGAMDSGFEDIRGKVMNEEIEVKSEDHLCVSILVLKFPLNFHKADLLLLLLYQPFILKPRLTISSGPTTSLPGRSGPGDKVTVVWPAGKQAHSAARSVIRPKSVATMKSTHIQAVHIKLQD